MPFAALAVTARRRAPLGSLRRRYIPDRMLRFRATKGTCSSPGGSYAKSATAQTEGC